MAESGWRVELLKFCMSAQKEVTDSTFPNSAGFKQDGQIFITEKIHQCDTNTIWRPGVALNALCTLLSLYTAICETQQKFWNIRIASGIDLTQVQEIVNFDWRCQNVQHIFNWVESACLQPRFSACNRPRTFGRTQKSGHGICMAQYGIHQKQS